jgi:hypothetical protein
MRLRTSSAGDELRTRMGATRRARETRGGRLKSHGTQSIQQRLRDLGSTEKLRLTLIAADGTVIVDSGGRSAGQPRGRGDRRRWAAESTRRTRRTDTQYFARPGSWK